MPRLWQECKDPGDPHAQLSWILSMIDFEDVLQCVRLVQMHCERCPRTLLPLHPYKVLLDLSFCRVSYPSSLLWFKSISLYTSPVFINTITLNSCVYNSLCAT